MQYKRWTIRFINSLPDSHFLYIEPGGKRDSEGKTTPRYLRRFPYKNASGNIDLPHLRGVIANIPQAKHSDGSPFSQSLIDRLQAEARRILERENKKALRWVARSVAVKVLARLGGEHG